MPVPVHVTSVRRLGMLVAAAWALALAVGGPAALLAAGPPFPDPASGVAVYDEADVFSPATEAEAELIIDAIEARTGVEIVVYSQVVDYGVTTAEAEQHAIALMDQWGVGRAGFDDGLVILFDVDPSRVHGQVRLYAGPGYRAAYLSNEDRQRIFDQTMVPDLQREDLDGALLAGLREVDRATTVEHAGELQLGRQLNAALGLIVAPLAFGGIVFWAVRGWALTGRDPELADSTSILLPAPPPNLTPAAAALLLEGKATRRSLTSAMLDLAARGLVRFREEKGFLGFGPSKVGIDLAGATGSDTWDEYERQRAARQPLGPAEELAYAKLIGVAGTDRYLEPDEMLTYGQAVTGFDKRLEQHATSQGWFREPPTQASRRWQIRATLVLVAGVIVLFGGFPLPSSGLVLVGGALVAAAIVLYALAGAMPARTKAGVLQVLQLRAYRRTLERTMAEARSMDQVVAQSGLDWLQTPDRAVVWGVALGLEQEVERVLERSLDDIRDGRATGTYLPSWYTSGSTGGSGAGWSSGGSLLSSSAIPNFGGMMAALGTIGNTPSDSGGGGGFGGGSSGGGGGGAGGGF